MTAQTVDIRLLMGNHFTQFINGLFEMGHFHFQFDHPIFHAPPLFIYERTPQTFQAGVIPCIHNLP